MIVGALRATCEDRLTATTRAIACSAREPYTMVLEGRHQMTRAYECQALKPLGPRLEPPRPWWGKWLVLAVFAASVRAGAGVATR
jgi:hypothetical protein